MTRWKRARWPELVAAFFASAAGTAGALPAPEPAPEPAAEPAPEPDEEGVTVVVTGTRTPERAQGHRERDVITKEEADRRARPT